MIYIKDVYHNKGVRRGDADDEGIYLLAKDLAYNVALDQTSQLTEGIKQLQKKEMKLVSDSINNLDLGKGGSSAIDKKICKTASSTWSNFATEPTDTNQGKCAAVSGITGKMALSVVMSDENKAGDSLFTDDKKLSAIPNTSATISKDVSNLNRDQKGVVSSAFAKAHEGAEIVEIRSISTTSVMVNACYDVLTDGLPVSPYGCAGHKEGLRTGKVWPCQYQRG